MICRKRKAIRLKTAIPNLGTSGIFADLASLGVTLPWDTSAASLDILYYGRSARKIVSPIVYDFYVDNDPEGLTAEQRTALALAVWGRYGTKWTARWELETNIDSLQLIGEEVRETYTSEETRDRDTTSSGTVTTDRDTTDTGTVQSSNQTTDTGTVQSSNQTTNTGTVTTARETTDAGTVGKTGNTSEGGTVQTEQDTTDTGTVQSSNQTTDTGTINRTGDDLNSRWGFNSASAVPSDSSETTSSETRNLAGSESGTETRNLAGSNDTLETRNLTGTTSETETRNLEGTEDTTETRDLAGSESGTQTRNLAGSETGTETRNLTGTDDTTETRNLAGTDDETKTHEYTRTITRTPADAAEIAENHRVMLDYNYFEKVFQDLDEFYTIPIY